jgi:phosphatidate cytidylyltransferase
MQELYENKIVNFDCLPIQLHGLVFGLFASLVAPFGGFFASAIKRAYGKKDFDSFMPGHGGMMDRMDCQLIMIMFTSFYLSTFIDTRTLQDKLSDILMTLDDLSDVFKTLDNETIGKIKEVVNLIK